MKIFEIHNKGGTLSLEWFHLGYGYCALNWHAFRIYHQFFTRGIPELGSQREFIFRFSMELEKEPKFSWLTLELFNGFEGRIFYLWMKLWKEYTLDIALNFGFRVSKKSRIALAQMKQRQTVETLKALKPSAPIQAGGNRTWPKAAPVSLKVMK